MPVGNFIWYLNTLLGNHLGNKMDKTFSFIGPLQKNIFRAII